MKSLSNIFINTRENKLRLAEVYFSKKIEAIKFSSDEFDWKDIDTIEKLNIFIASNRLSIEDNYSLLMPGAIDPHVHFDTPGFEFREDFEHASTAAAYGGVTTIIDMPCTSIPPVTNLTNINTKLDNLISRSLIDYGFWGGISGNDITDLIKIETQVNELSEAGVAGFKIYVISGMSEFTDLTYEQIKHVAQIVKETGKPLAVHAEDKSLVDSRQNELQQRNKNSWKDYCYSRDIKAEVTAINKLIKIAEETGCKIHVVHLSSQKGLELIDEAKRKGISISTETCPHYLYFTQSNFENESIRNYLKTAPPVKFENDRKALWDGLGNDEIEFVTTDHAGCNPIEEKRSENFWEVYGGIPGVEHRVPFLFSEGFLKELITLEHTINLLSSNTARFFNIQNKGEIKEGKDADFALIDLWNSQTLTANQMHSKGKYTPFEGMRFNCIVRKTFLRGEIIMNQEDNCLAEMGFGKFIKMESKL